MRALLTHPLPLTHHLPASSEHGWGKSLDLRHLQLPSLPPLLSSPPFTSPPLCQTPRGIAFTTTMTSTGSSIQPTLVPHQVTQRPPRDRYEEVLEIIQFAYPVVLVFFFLVVFTARSILSADNRNPDTPNEPQLLGPGGKPLPRSSAQRASSRKNKANEDVPRSQKLLFQWISVFVCLTFVGNAAVAILHALVNRKEGYWCGKAYVVSACSQQYAHIRARV